MVYYVIIGQLISSTLWEQVYIVPFRIKTDAEDYMKFFKSNHTGYDVFISENVLIRPNHCGWPVDQ